MPKRRTAKGSFWAQDPVVTTQQQTKLKLAYAINRAIKHRKLQRAATAGMLDVAPQKIASLRSYNLRNFSIEELSGFLTALSRGHEVSDHRRN